MDLIRGTLVCDGSSDQMLIPILHWLFEQNGLEAVEIVRPRLGGWRNPPRTLAERISAAVALAPCDLLFVHRDAEGVQVSLRDEEIAIEIQKAQPLPPHVPVIPIRMSEAWLLFDEKTLRRVAGKPNGKVPLDFPRIGQLENLLDPKKLLLDLLVKASELNGRRLDRFKAEAHSKILQLAEFIPDFSPIRNLTAFQKMEQNFMNAIGSLELIRL